MDPVVTGVYEDGHPQQMWLPGDKHAPGGPRNATHGLIMGMNGSGKSHGAKIVWTELLTRRDVQLRIADPSKGRQTVGAFADYLDALYLDEESGAAAIDGLLDEIRSRADWLGVHGYDQWVPEVGKKAWRQRLDALPTRTCDRCGHPECHGLDYIVLWVEEAATLVRDSQSMIDAAQQARSAGMSIVLSMQRPSFRNITTDVRAQLGLVWCFGVNALADAAFALDDDVIDRGANPAVWKNQKPGCNYLVAPGVHEDRQVIPARTYATSDEEMLAAIAAVREPSATGGQATVTPTPRTRPEQPRRRIVVDPFRTATITDDEDENPLTEVPSVQDDLDLYHVTDEDPLTDLPEDMHVPFGGGKPSPSQAMDLLRGHLAALADAGTTSVGPKDLVEPMLGARSRSWISEAMKKLAADGELIETDAEGVYHLSPGVLTKSDLVPAG
jgi:hypothetical protein